jgi:hypothetical protein
MRDSKGVQYLVALDFNGLVKRYGMKDTVVPYSTGTDLFFEGVIIEEIIISSRFDFRNLSYAAQKVTVRIANASRLQDEETRVNLDGGTGSVYVWAPGLDWADIETNGLIFKGVFELVSYDRHTLTFNLTDFAEKRWKTIPDSNISTSTWPSARVAGGSGSVIGTSQAMVFGAWTKGVPLRCVDTAGYKYLAMAGVSSSVDADYTAGTVDVYDKDGAVIDPAGYVFYPSGADTLGNLVAYFDFTSDKVASETLSCSIEGIGDGSGEITGTAAALIEHPADIIYYLMKYHSLLESTEIHVESLKTMRSLLPGIEFASIINSQANGLDIVQRMLKQCSAAMLSIGGKVGVMTLVTDGPTMGALKWDHHLIGSGATITKTPYDEIRNRIRARYALNPTTGRWEGELARDRTNDADCAKSYYDYGEQPEYSADFADVQSEAHAVALVRRLIELKGHRHDIVEIEVPVWDGFDFREGDSAVLSIREGASSGGSGWTDEKCVLVERTFKRRTIVQKWWRIGR